MSSCFSPVHCRPATMNLSAVACRFGSICVKFGCPFKHPPSRPQDCPDGEFCDEAKCPLHHPKSRPIRQQKRPVSILQTKACPTAGLGVESKQAMRPCTISFSKLVPRPSSTSRASTRYSNRKIVRSPMVVASPHTRPTTGYFVATTKQCVNGAACVKYGCTYKHPAARASDCPLGAGCKGANCARLHPVNELGNGARDAGFEVGQSVLAKFLPNSTRWSRAKIIGIRGSALTLRFDGFADAFKLPLRRVRQDNDKWASVRSPRPPTPRSSLPPRARSRSPSPPPRNPPPRPRSPVSQLDIDELQRLKHEAVAREEFLAAAQIKRQIDTLELEKQKQQAVDDEDFLLAMDLKKKIADLQSADQSCAAK